MNTSEQLERINNSIGAIENGAQEYRIGNRSLKRADLATLYKERQELSNRLIQEQNNGNTTVARFCGR